MGLSYLLGHKKEVGIDSRENVDTYQTSGYRSDHPQSVQMPAVTSFPCSLLPKE